MQGSALRDDVLWEDSSELKWRVENKARSLCIRRIASVK